MLSRDRRDYILLLSLIDQVLSYGIDEETEGLLLLARGPNPIDPSTIDHPAISGSEISFVEVFQEFQKRLRLNPNNPEEALRFTLIHKASESLVRELGESFSTPGDDSYFDYIPNAVNIITAAGNYNPDELSSKPPPNPEVPDLHLDPALGVPGPLIL